MNQDSLLENIIEQFHASGHYRILHKLVPQASYGNHDGRTKLRRGIILDTETTGLDPKQDAIIELGLVPFEYCPLTFTVVKVHPSICYFEDPQRPIPAEITQLTGITDEMVKGQKIDEAVVLDAFSKAGLIIAHNASFDRPFIDRRFPSLKDKPWACSFKEVPWKNYGFAASSLEFLIFKKCGLFFDGHRADTDCLALLHLLATPFKDQTLPLGLLLASARQETCRVWALDSPFDSRPVLKERRYRWNSGDDGRAKAWYIELAVEQLEAELDWLTENVYQGVRGLWQVDQLTAKQRYAEGC